MIDNVLDIINNYLPGLNNQEWFKTVSSLYNTDGSLKTMDGTKTGTPIMGIYKNERFYMTPKYYANKKNAFNSWWNKEIQPSISGNIVSNGPTYNTDWIRAQRAQKGGYSNADEFVNYLISSPESNEAKLFAQAGFTDDKGNLDKNQISTLLNERGIRKNLGRRDSGRLANILTQLQKQATTGSDENHAFMEAAVDQYNTNYAGKANQEDKYLMPTLKYNRNAKTGNELSMINSEGKEIGENVGFDKNPNSWGNKASEFVKKQNNNWKTFMNNTIKFQDGGAMQADPQQQIMALVQAAMQGDQEAQSTIQQIQQAAQQGDQQASQMLQMIQGVMQQMQGQAQMAKKGAKLNYINRLKGNCPEGYQMNYFKVGGKVCRQCQKMETPKAKCGKKMVKKGCSGMVKGIRAEMGAKLESMKKGGSTAFGDRSHTPASTNAQGRFGGRKAFNEYGTHKHPKVTRNVFSAFGDEGKKKPTNVGLVGHHATGNTGLMRTKETAKNNKHTAFGAAVARFHKGAKPTSKGGITTIKGAPKGKSHDGGLKKVTKNAFGGLLLIK